MKSMPVSVRTNSTPSFRGNLTLLTRETLFGFPKKVATTIMSDSFISMKPYPIDADYGARLFTKENIGTGEHLRAVVPKGFTTRNFIKGVCNIIDAIKDNTKSVDLTKPATLENLKEMVTKGKFDIDKLID